jgi:chromosome segregation ATPase
VEFLKSIPQPIAIVGVAGMYRTGKSFLLNRVILNRGSGFGVGPTINPCTKGIWIWGKPLKGQTSEGEIVNLLVIDSEGIGALDESAEHDARIFSLAILLSSCFIYNSVGSIDENALQNLNLVVNITKNIHLKSKGNEDVDADEYSQYFPSFLWVVRDFALQLVDQDGEPMTAREYLENGLQPQKGFSETVENKNRIRRMIQSFFKDRDCCTMIRPLTDERSLQNLQNMELDQLRPDFVEQVLYLRKRITGKAKIKMLNGKPLTGFMIASLLQSYVTSINEGAVPNIENAWTYICKSQCSNALQAAYNEYDEMMKDTLVHSWPLAPEYLTSIHKDCREQALRSYKRAAVGDYREQYLEELENRIGEKLSWLEAENKRDFERILLHGLSTGYAKIEKRLTSGDYKDFFEYEKDLRNLQMTYYDTEPSGPNKEGLISEFVLKKLPEGVYSFLTALKKENEAAITDLERQRQRLEKEISGFKEESVKEKNRLNSIISDLESARGEMKVHLQCVTENLETLKAEKEEIEKRLGGDLSTERTKYKQQIQELQTNIEGLKSTCQSQERKILLLTSEFEKDKALMAQKLSFYEMSDRSLGEKEKNLQEEISKAKEEFNLQLKAITQKNRETIDKLEADNRLLNQRFSDMQEDLSEMDSQKGSLANQLKEKENAYKIKINQLTSRIEELEKDMASNSRSTKGEMDPAQETELRRQLESAVLKASSLEQETRTKEEDFKLKRSKFDKEKAILQQNINFLETQLADVRSQMEESKKIHESALKALEGNPLANRVDVSKQIETIKETHKRELRQLEAELANTRKRLTDELADMQTQRDEAEKRLNLLKSEMSGEIGSLSEQVFLLTTERERWLGDSKTSEEAKFRLVKEIEERYKNKMMSIERDNEELKDRHMVELAELQQKSEEDFKRIKQFFEEERVRLETKILEDKERYEKKLSSTIEDYEQKASRDQQYHEEEVENLQEDLKEMEIQHVATVQHLEQELNMRQQQLDTLEKQLKETKDQLRQLQQHSNQALEQALKDYTEERKSLTTKLEQAKADLAQKEKDIYSARQVNDSLKAELEKAKEKRDEKILQLTEENQKLTEKTNEVTQNYQKLSEEFMDKKIEYGKNVALSQQQNEFYSKRIEELQKQLDDSNRRTEDKLRAQRDTHTAEIDKLLNQQKEEKALLEEKYETKRKALKESETKYQRKIGEIEKELALISEKLSNSEAEYSKLDRKQANEIESLVNQINTLKDAHVQDKKGLVAELENHKKRVYDLELENAEIISNYEKDKALWEGKLKFLESQRDQYKEDTAEIQRNFETMLESFRKYKTHDKEETVSSQNVMIATIEQKYNSQIYEINESHKNAINELGEKIQRLERDNKTLQDRLQNEGSSKSSSLIKSLEAKAAELANREQSLNDQLFMVKTDRDQKLIEHQQILEKERESWKKRMNELEARFKDVEGKKNAQLFDFEKERTKWNIERDHLNNQRQDFLENIDKLEKRKDALLRENEKLKTENRKNKKLIGNSNLPGFTPNLMANLNGSKFGEKSFNRDQ